MSRPTFDQVYMAMARIVATRATCDRAHVGAVLVDRKNRIISTGYNGAPSGLPHCDDVGHLMEHGHCVRTLHAEANAIVSSRADLNGATLYVTHFPCVRCANLVTASGIVRVVAGAEYCSTSLEARAILTAGGVRFDLVGVAPTGEPGLQVDMFTEGR